MTTLPTTTPTPVASQPLSCELMKALGWEVTLIHDHRSGQAVIADCRKGRFQVELYLLANFKPVAFKEIRGEFLAIGQPKTLGELLGMVRE
jgi:hypothetical protein